MADSNLKSEGPLIQTLRLKQGPGRPSLENAISWPWGLHFGPKIKWQPGPPQPLPQTRHCNVAILRGKENDLSHAHNLHTRFLMGFQSFRQGIENGLAPDI